MAKNKKRVTLEASHVSMKFNLNQEKHDSIKEVFINLFRHTDKRKEGEFWALKDISFKLHPGDRVGILGLNGAGKSTLLKALAGVYKPTEGVVTRKGKIAPLLELGAGFDKEYTARENIYLYGAVLGYKKEFIDQKFDDIVEFAELGQFVDVPVKNYSSGMRSRLGFSICTAVDPDILILDEVLSVGDAKFRKKSEARIKEMFEGDVTVLFVSHSLEQVKRICNKAMILDHGELKAFGDIEDVAAIYQELIAGDEEVLKKKAKNMRKTRKVRRKVRHRDAYLLMKNHNLSLDEIFDVMEVPEAQREKFEEGIKRVEENQKKKAQMSVKVDGENGIDNNTGI
ncbi:MAG: ABC transporter ATP-binding protein [Lachnospiraceae bacterium]|nr:ABC transporter ATP-binding protein [Lachnospiraceae bacterium]